jgi:hypothetical protein
MYEFWGRIPWWVIAVPGLALIICILGDVIEELSGEGRWYRHQRHSMESERPLLSDGDFLTSEGVSPEDAPHWLGTRRAIAAAIGLAPEAIYPHNRLADLWRMQRSMWFGQDLLDIVFRLERELGIKIPRPFFVEVWDPLISSETTEFRALVAGLIDLLRRDCE